MKKMNLMGERIRRFERALETSLFALTTAVVSGEMVALFVRFALGWVGLA